jgi:electron transfer flavoprotein beta subunit
MKILVCISKVPDTTTKISFDESKTKLNTPNVQWIVNPSDEWYALVRALELQEANAGSTVTLINVGGADSEAVIRKALAIGGDSAVRVDVEPTDSFQVADAIASYAKDQGFDLILTGKETIDGNSSVTGAMIAELLDLPYITLANKLDVEGNGVKVERESEYGDQIIKAAFPLVVSAAKGVADARIPNMRGIMAARSKPVTVLSYSGSPLTSVESYSLPPEKGAVKMIAAENAEELITLLHTEAKVI